MTDKELATMFVFFITGAWRIFIMFLLANIADNLSKLIKLIKEEK